jgi:hypothetical protein
MTRKQDKANKLKYHSLLCRRALEAAVNLFEKEQRRRRSEKKERGEREKQ